MSSDSSPWLSEAEQRVWRSWLSLNAKLPVLLHRQLQAESELSLQDFEVLVMLTESPDPRLRVSDLARMLDWERSRLSHHVKRMEGKGLVGRQGCSDDGRGAFVVLTSRGREAMERAAPGHARTVRDLMFGALDAEEVASLESMITKVLGRVDEAAAPCAMPPLPPCPRV